MKDVPSQQGRRGVGLTHVEGIHGVEGADGLGLAQVPRANVPIRTSKCTHGGVRKAEVTRRWRRTEEDGRKGELMRLKIEERKSRKVKGEGERECELHNPQLHIGQLAG